MTGIRCLFGAEKYKVSFNAFHLDREIIEG